MSDDHLSIDELAELDEGLITSARADSLRQHLDNCPDCSAKLAAIASTRSMLGALPPVTMPPEVRARLDQALDAEADGSASDSSTTPAIELVPDLEPEPRVDAGPAIDSSSRSADVVPAAGTVVRPRFGRPTAASSAVAAAVVLVAGAIIVGHYHHGGANGGADAAGSGGSAASISSGNDEIGPGSLSKSATSVVVTSSGKTYTVNNIRKLVQHTNLEPISGGVSTPPTNGGNLPASSTPGGVSGGGSGGGQQQPSKAPAPTTAQDFGSRSAPVPHVLKPLYNSRKKQLACATTLTGENAVPLQVDFGRWTDANHHNSPAAIFIFAGIHPSTVAVWVTNASCSGNKVVRTYQQVAVTN